MDLRPPSPAPSGVSMRSDRSKNEPENFRTEEPRPPSPAHSGVSMRSDWSKNEPENFRKEPRPPSPAPSGVSMRSDWSKDEPENFRKEEPRPPSPAPSGVSVRSDWSKNEPENFRNEELRPPSPAPSGVSMRSDWSKDEPENFRREPRPPSPAPSGVSMRSYWSKDEPENFRKEQPRPPSPASSGVSMRSDWSKDEPENLRKEPRPPSPAPSGVSMRSDWSKDEPENFRREPKPPSPAPSGVSMRSDWSKDEPENFRKEEPRPRQDKTAVSDPTTMDPYGAIDSTPEKHIQILSENGKKKILDLYEKDLSEENNYSELYEMVGEKELGQKQTYNDIFQSKEKTIRTVLSKGVARVGKTFYSRMLMVDWAKGRSNQNIDLIVPLHFRELNERRDTDQSMKDLLNDILNDFQQRDVCNYECTLAFVLDGLEECELPLDFKNNKKLTDTEEAASMDELLTNLIKGDLLPNAHLWIISQPSGVKKIPQEHIEKVTECRESLKRREQLVSNLRKRFQSGETYRLKEIREKDVKLIDVIY